MSFNIDKCLVLSVKDCVSRPDYYLDGKRLENVNSHLYLGIELAYNLKWSRHIVAKASGRFGLLRRALKSADSRTRQAHTRIWMPGVGPVFD